MKTGYVYILANRYRTLYVGVTSDPAGRLWQHREEVHEGFTKKYHLHRLVYIEACPDMESAIAREKQIKGWLRARKVALIEQQNPKWEDLSVRLGLRPEDVK